MSGASVALIRTLTSELSEALFAFTDAAGAFRFSDLDEGDYRLTVTSGDTLVATLGFTLSGSSPAEVVLSPLALARAGVFRGRALRPGTSNHSGVFVTADDLASFPATTDSTGAYRLTGIPVGTWAVTAATLLQSYAAHGQGSLAAPGDTVTLPDLLLAPVPIPVALHARHMARARGLAPRAEPSRSR